MVAVAGNVQLNYLLRICFQKPELRKLLDLWIVALNVKGGVPPPHLISPWGFSNSRTSQEHLTLFAVYKFLQCSI